MTIEQLQTKIDELQSQLDEMKEAEQGVEPVFPDTCCYVATHDGGASYVTRASMAAARGRTHRTMSGANDINSRDAARTRCIEAINKVNRGDNGFKKGGENHRLSYNYGTATFEYTSLMYLCNQEPWEYIRTDKAAKQLLQDEQFTKDWLLVKGINHE